ncbi:flagellar hook-basal body complex protein FliE [Candidatus Bathyarchaeota archaeon]|nr:flagellar hook-basal body complex protein FliE [Candidatus Bathyarchaeota archaeon]
MNREKTVIAIAAMPGAGKGTAAELASDRGIPVIICGNVVREEASRRGMAQTQENLGSLMLRMRDEEGPDVVVRRLIPRIAETESNIVVVEGLRSLDELKLLRRHFKVRLLAIHSSPDQRLQRLLRRRRSDDPSDYEEFQQRDMRELAVGIGSVIALADHLIVNDSTIEAFKSELNRFYEEVL